MSTAVSLVTKDATRKGSGPQRTLTAGQGPGFDHPTEDVYPRASNRIIVTAMFQILDTYTEIHSAPCLCPALSCPSAFGCCCFTREQTANNHQASEDSPLEQETDTTPRKGTRRQQSEGRKPKQNSQKIINSSEQPKM